MMYFLFILFKQDLNKWHAVLHIQKKALIRKLYTHTVKLN